MVGIVLVTHSALLAQSVKELTGLMVSGRVPIGIAGGMDDEEHPFGTDATRISAAIESVYSDDGVLVLMDIGSSLLSAGLALEFLPEEKRKKVLLCEAPIVEGAAAAAVRSEGGGSLAEVADEARRSLDAKKAQLDETYAAPGTPPEPGPVDTTGSFPLYAKEISEQARGAVFVPHPSAASGTAKELSLTVRNRLGFHARPVSQLIRTASRFRSNITVRNITRNTGPAGAQSINELMTLGVRYGHEISLSADGPDADAALSALKNMIETGFGDDTASIERHVSTTGEAASDKKISGAKPFAGQPEDETTTFAATAPAGVVGEFQIRGIPASPGIAVGPSVRYRPAFQSTDKRKPENPKTEWSRLEAALEKVREQISRTRRRMAAEAGDYEASIFDAHILVLSDPALLEPARMMVFNKSYTAENAWNAAVEKLAASYRADDSSYIRARESDILDIKAQVLHILTQAQRPHFIVSVPSVILASRLFPSDVTGLDQKKVIGVCASYGAANSHTSILLRSLDIPSVVGAGIDIMKIHDKTSVVLDGTAGMLLVDPANTALYMKKRKSWLISIAREKQDAGMPAVSADGKKVPVLANIGSVAEAVPAREKGADGIGVLRTEFLFLRREAPPAEDAHVEAYTAIADVFGTLPVTVRALDAGGDKPLPYLTAGPEDNPALGKKGIRLLLDRPDILKTQIRAVFIASAGHSLKIMLPMVTSVHEVRSAKKIFEEVKEELAAEGRPFDRSTELGIMIEVPAAALSAAPLSRESSFFSIGTNDLSQYTLAADRTNPDLLSLNDALHPALLSLIKCTVSAGHAAGIPVSVCGEIAGDPTAVPVLLGLGIDALSMNPSSIPGIKSEIRKTAIGNAKQLAEEALRCSSAEEVREKVQQW